MGDYLLLLAVTLLTAGIWYSLLKQRNKKISDITKPVDKYCPLCGTHLKPHETVLLELVNNKSPYKGYIKGCKFCYKAYTKEQIPEIDVYFNGKLNVDT